MAEFIAPIGPGGVSTVGDTPIQVIPGPEPFALSQQAPATYDC